MSVIQKLNGYYRKNGISTRDFRCEHLADCRAGSRSFAKGREAYVGRLYEKTRPRLVILSADPGSERVRGGEDERSMLQQRKDLERFVPKGNRHKHWYNTLRFAAELLTPFNDNVCFDNVVRYFAHINSAKCCQNKESSAQADPILFNNCKRFIPGELEILAPDVIWTQGDKAKDALQSCKEIREAIPGTRKLENTKLVDVFGRRVLWIATYHPTQPNGLFYTRDWKMIERYSNLLRKFVESYVS